MALHVDLSDTVRDFRRFQSQKYVRFQVSLPYSTLN